MPDPLKRVSRAAASKRRADLEYRAALVAAVAELEAVGQARPYGVVARAAGVSRQAVRVIVARAAKV